MDKRIVNLVFHVGRGKTATSYLQKNASKIKDAIFIGRINSEKYFIDPVINKIHYKLFPPYRGELLKSFPNPSTNSYELVDKYSSALYEIIKNNKNAKNIIISDDLSMKSLKGSIGENTIKTFNSGCNIALHCNGDFKEMEIVAKNSPLIDKFILKKTSQFYKILG